jgi:hypothetical protein
MIRLAGPFLLFARPLVPDPHMVPSPSISPRLAEEFFEAVREYIRWNFGDPEPSITVDRHLVRISLVCGRVDGFTDPLPDEVFDAVDFLLIDRRRRAELRANRTYATAARCFREAIEDKKRKYSENEERDPKQR